MQKLISLAVVIALALLLLDEAGLVRRFVGETAGTDAVIAEAYESRKSNLRAQGSGRVARVLPDDDDGSRHQRFTIRLSSGHTLLIAHNIDLAPRISSISEGDVVEFYGEYEWNSKGGVVHWTHKDPQDLHEAGWLEHEGATYQ